MLVVNEQIVIGDFLEAETDSLTELQRRYKYLQAELLVDGYWTYDGNEDSRVTSDQLLGVWAEFMLGDPEVARERFAHLYDPQNGWRLASGQWREMCQLPLETGISSGMLELPLAALIACQLGETALLPELKQATIDHQRSFPQVRNFWVNGYFIPPMDDEKHSVHSTEATLIYLTYLASSGSKKAAERAFKTLKSASLVYTQANEEWFEEFYLDARGEFSRYYTEPASNSVYYWQELLQAQTSEKVITSERLQKLRTNPPYTDTYYNGTHWITNRLVNTNDLYDLNLHTSLLDLIVAASCEQSDFSQTQNLPPQPKNIDYHA